jgi:hypothetical protein
LSQGRVERSTPVASWGLSFSTIGDKLRFYSCTPRAVRRLLPCDARVPTTAPRPLDFRKNAKAPGIPRRAGGDAGDANVRAPSSRRIAGQAGGLTTVPYCRRGALEVLTSRSDAIHRSHRPPPGAVLEALRHRSQPWPFVRGRQGRSPIFFRQRCSYQHDAGGKQTGGLKEEGTRGAFVAAVRRVLDEGSSGSRPKG